MLGIVERAALIAGSCLFFCLLFVLAPPGIVFGDGAELTYGILANSVIHPPGYPLYRLFGRQFFLLGSVNPGLAMSALSALFSSLSLAVLYLFLRRRGLSVLVSGISLCLLAVAFPVWDVSLKPEVYSLAAFFFASTVYFWDLVLRDGRGRTALWVLVGLSLAHHPLSVLNLLLALHATWKTHPAFRFREALAVLVPLTLYGLLLLPGTGFPFNWPKIATAGALTTHVLGGSFGRFLFGYGAWTPLIQSGRILAAHLVAFPFFVTVVLLLGYGTLDRNLFPLVGLQALFLLGVSIYGIPDLHDFLLPSFFVSAVVTAYGLQACRRQGITTALVVLTLLVGSYGLFGYVMGENIRYDWRTYDYPAVYAAKVDKHLHRGVLLSDWSHYSVLRYYQLTEERFSRTHLLTPTHRFNRWSEIVRYHRQRGQPVYAAIRTWDRPDDIRLLERGPIYEARLTPDG